MHAGGAAELAEQTWSWALPFELTAAGMVRGRLSGLLRAHGVDAEVVDDACAVMSELVGNALRHSRPRSNGQLEATVVLGQGSVFLAVADGGASTVPSLVSPTPLARRGRGLGIVHSLTTDWGVREGVEGNTVFGILSRA